MKIYFRILNILECICKYFRLLSNRNGKWIGNTFSQQFMSKAKLLKCDENRILIEPISYSNECENFDELAHWNINL